MTEPAPASDVAPPERKVWDAAVRLTHLGFAVCVLGSWASAQADAMQVHFYFGYAMLGLLTFRIVWGVVGSRHARFRHFVKGPAKVAAYAQALRRGDGAQTVGHNPLGAISVLVLLGLLAAQAISGLFASDDILWAGPYNGAVDQATARNFTNYHHINYRLLVGAILIHVFAVGWYVAFKQQDVFWPMVSGKKSASVVPKSEAIGAEDWRRIALVAAASAVAVYGVIASAPPPAAGDWGY
ncbi:MAG: cytochrome b/b6 domain-containing protein [Maricaulaceae bacterium]